MPQSPGKSKLRPSFRWDDGDGYTGGVCPGSSFQRMLEFIAMNALIYLQEDNGFGLSSGRERHHRNDFRRFSSIHLSAWAGV